MTDLFRQDRLVSKFNGSNWKQIAAGIPGRSDIQCLHPWKNVLNPEIIKMEKVKAQDPIQEDMATHKKESRIAEAEQNKREALEHNAALSHGGAPTGGSADLGEGPTNYTTIHKNVVVAIYELGKQKQG